VTVPLKMLQNNSITFSPELPSDKLEAINTATVWDGCKAFIEFSEKFYPTFVPFITTPETAGQKLYYDAAYGQNTSQHILGLFAVGSEAQPYLQRTNEDLIDYMLNELDEIFDNQASATYVKHTFQNWNEEPYINGAYLFDYTDWRKLPALAATVEDKVLFAGEAYAFENDWGSVHAAARAAKRAVEELVA
ncbi:MAG: FAD-dependent oxidoreductase, partial [Bacteroidota bacterium]